MSDQDNLHYQQSSTGAFIAAMQFCQNCRKPIRELKEGTLTNFVLKASTCTCKFLIRSSEEIRRLDQLDLGVLKLGNRFVVLSELGTGGMGTVYVGKDRATQQVVAIKVLRDDLATSEAAVKRFQEEVLAAQFLNHPNMVSIQGCGTTPDGTPYLVMEYVDGANLAELIRQEKRLSPEVVAGIFVEVCAALADAHQKNIVHRDIKPENILIMPLNDDDIRVKVVDFGIAKVLYEADDDREEGDNKSTDIVGSPLYMSPEQCTGIAVDKRTDIYSIGCVMYEALTGVSPFYSTNPVKTIMMHLKEEPKPFQMVDPDLRCPQELELIVLKCLRKDPKQRYRSTLELQKDLIAFDTQNLTSAGKEVMAMHAMSIIIVGLFMGLLAFAMLNPILMTKMLEPDKYFRINNRYTGKPIYETVNVDSFRDALEQAVRKDIDLSGADLRQANLSGLNLSHAKLSESDLSRASLAMTVFTGADLSYANLSGAFAPLAVIDQANLKGVDLTGAQLGKARLNQAKVQSADLSFANLGEATIMEANFDGTDIDHANFHNSKRDGTSFNSTYGEATFDK